MSRVEQAYLRMRQPGRQDVALPSSLSRYSSESTADFHLPEAGVEPPSLLPEPAATAPAPPLESVAMPPLEPEPLPPTAGAAFPTMADIAVRQPVAIPEAALLTGGQDVLATEQYSRLAATLHDAQVEQGIKTLMVTSALPREGKTLTSINLALTLGELYSRRVLLIDADLRRPSVHSVLRLSSRSGLGEALRASHAPLPIVKVTPHLSVIVGGRPEASPVADLASARMKAVLDQARAHFDWVILDTPPAALLPDANLIARWADGVLLVIAARRTPYRTIQEAMELIGPGRVIGSVLNRSDRSTRTDDYYAHYSPDHSQ